MPMTAGSTPTAAKEQKTPRDGKLAPQGLTPSHQQHGARSITDLQTEAQEVWTLRTAFWGPSTGYGSDENES